MNHKLNSKVEDLRQNDPSQNTGTSNYKKYDSPGNIRNLVLTWPDGKQKNCNYAYLVNTEYSPEEGRITLCFTSETITLIGANLDQLHYDFRYQLPEEIVAINKRYASIGSEVECFIFEILVKK